MTSTRTSLPVATSSPRVTTSRRSVPNKAVPAGRSAESVRPTVPGAMSARRASSTEVSFTLVRATRARFLGRKPRYTISPAITATVPSAKCPTGVPKSR